MKDNLTISELSNNGVIDIERMETLDFISLVLNEYQLQVNEKIVTDKLMKVQTALKNMKAFISMV